MDNLVSIARIVKTRGVRGEVVGELLTDFPDRFGGLSRVTLSGPTGVFEAEIERHWFHQDRVVLKFVGWDTPERARELVGSEVQIPSSERVELPEGLYYDSDLEGCRVVEGDVDLGVVASVWRIGDVGSNLVVLDDAGREFVIPFVKQFLVSVDVGGRIIRVQLPPGLVDLAVPGRR